MKFDSYVNLGDLCAHVYKQWLTCILAILPKIHFYLSLIYHKLSDQLTWHLLCKYIVVLCLFTFIFKSMYAMDFFPISANRVYVDLLAVFLVLFP